MIDFKKLAKILIYIYMNNSTDLDHSRCLKTKRDVDGRFGFKPAAVKKNMVLK